ncbi:MAG: 30S ribosomal protein S12 methylthiotransferase RimO [Candidatus Margulisiibacteriota bacterium]|nr:MAG: ribosomal protein S12 methylthiotransferase RimO [Candidatus Margulisbacteria bacterium GWD2_39_127]OGI02110.1 MAG: ribosomal protein S12 methylthiotransferase RimO [Candidatus Margulisbacteria bacterium GWF2_38_17]OGI10487.1 MAG: ribosomal protein S12 methylthiotransferase RimO [Candidatus Margulisbacteria bacterium GWE2_39_32]PZM79967.1 MAG: 30S ribosomal protein S12 methylthiotransferase RimO [Candidatus Margulisiibacteriota bacterium]HAR62433.1 30S ribosomal protein S12 methylthiotr
MAKKIALVSLGCQKNLIDSEIMLGILVENDFEITNNKDEADLVVINTCTFISDAREETTQVVEEFIHWKKSDNSRKLILAGCHVQREKKAIFSLWPEIDGIIGVNDIPNLTKLLFDLYKKNKTQISFINQTFCSIEYKFPRVISTLSASTYIKIAEGCDNFCSYCIIPQLRGNYRSRQAKHILQEVAELAAEGIRELCLIAQDIGGYGKDLKKGNLVSLLKDICKVNGIEWVRLLYLYPDNITDELIELIKNEPKICNYVDIPMQHSSDRILSLMNRRSTNKQLLALINKLREQIPGIVIRSTFIVGFPGETEEEFLDLLAFVKEVKLDKVGFFKYSREAGTKAAAFSGQVSEEDKEERIQALLNEQTRVLEEKNKELLGRQFTVIMDNAVSGRYYGQSPEVDGVILVQKSIGTLDVFQKVKIVDVADINLKGEFVA